MSRKPISVTLELDNVVWLKGRAGAVGESVSEVLDQIVNSARQGAYAGPGRSVVGSIDIDASDPLLEQAGATVRAAFEASIGRPFVLRERRSVSRTSRKRSPKRRV